MGSNDKGQLGMNDSTIYYNKPTAIMKYEKIVDIASGWYHNAVIDSERVVYTWGNTTDNQPKRVILN